jgi:hypothetical protein
MEEGHVPNKGTLETLASVFQLYVKQNIYVLDGYEYVIGDDLEHKECKIEVERKNDVGQMEYHLREISSDRAIAVFREAARDKLVPPKPAQPKPAPKLVLESEEDVTCAYMPADENSEGQSPLTSPHLVGGRSETVEIIKKL